MIFCCFLPIETRRKWGEMAACYSRIKHSYNNNSIVNDIKDMEICFCCICIMYIVHVCHRMLSSELCCLVVLLSCLVGLLTTFGRIHLHMWSDHIHKTHILRTWIFVKRRIERTEHKNDNTSIVEKKRLA